MLFSIYFQSFKKQYSFLKEEFFLFFPLLLYCFAQALPLFFEEKFSWPFFTLSVACCLLSIMFRFLGLCISFSIFFVIFYLYVGRQGFSFSEILWLQGCLISGFLSLFIFLMKMDDIIKKKCHQTFINQKKFNELQEENNKCLQTIQELELINIKTVNVFSLLEDKNKKDEEIISYVLEEKQLLEQQIKLLSEQKLFWISNYDNLHERLINSNSLENTVINDNEKKLQKNIYELNVSNKHLQEKNDKLQQDFFLLDIKYKSLLKNINEEHKDLCEEKPRLLNSFVKNSSELSHIRGQYNQLKEQFEDKKNQLHVTRQKLFSLEEMNFSQKREQILFLKENYFDLLDFFNVEQTIFSLEQEIILLEELVSHVLFQ